MSEAKTQYDVVVNLQLKKIEEAQRGIQKVAADMTKLQSKVELNRQAFSGMVSKIMAIGAAYVGVSAMSRGIMGAAKSAITFNAELETTKIGLASVIGAVQNIPFEQALKPAQKVFDQLKDDAITSTATTKEMFDIFQAIVGPISAAGYGFADVREITNSTVAAASALNVDFAQAQRDIGMMARGTAGMDVKLFSMLRSTGAIKEDAEQWNKKLTAGQRIEKLKTALAKFNPAAQAYGKSWKGITSSFTDITQQFLGLAGGPAFETIKKFLDGINQKMLQNRDTLTQSIQRWGETLGRTLEKVFGKLSAAMEYATNNWGKITSAFKTAAEVMKKAAIIMAASKIASVVNVPALMAGGVGGAGAALAALAPILLLVAGTVAVVIDNWSAFVSIIKDLTYPLQSLFGDLQRLAIAIWGMIGPSIKFLASLFGLAVWGAFLAVVQGLSLIVSVVTTAIENLNRAFATAAGALDRAGQAVFDFMKLISDTVAQLFGKTVTKGSRGLRPMYDSKIMSLNNQFESTAPKGWEPGFGSGTGRAVTKTINDFKGARITVKQDFRQADPDRIAIQMIEDINRQADARTQSGFVSAFAR